LAAEDGHFEIVKYLVEIDANIQASTKEGKIPLSLADIEANQINLSRKEYYAKTIQFLKNKEAENDEHKKLLIKNVIT
jgi:hypothetical protein